MYSCSSASPSQQWTYTESTGQIKVDGGTCLWTSQRNTNGGKVLMSPCGNTPSGRTTNQWTYTAGNGQLRVRDGQGYRNGKCLDSVKVKDGGKVQMWSCDTSNQNQQWNIGTLGTSLNA